MHTLVCLSSLFSLPFPSLPFSPRRICRRIPTLRSATKQCKSQPRVHSDACHNERRATFCFGPVGRKYRPFWIFNFQRSSKPLRAPPPSSCAPSRRVLPRPSSRCRLFVASSERAPGRTRALYDARHRCIFGKIEERARSRKIWINATKAFREIPRFRWERFSRNKVRSSLSSRPSLFRSTGDSYLRRILTYRSPSLFLSFSLLRSPPHAQESISRVDDFYGR